MDATSTFLLLETTPHLVEHCTCYIQFLRHDCYQPSADQVRNEDVITRLPALILDQLLLTYP